MVEKASIEDVMKVLTASHKQDLHELWSTCSHLVAKSGLPPDVLAKHLPVDLIATIQDLRRNSHQPNIAGHRFLPADPSSDSTAHKLRRMRRALDSSDVELVKLMVMGEGLNLDDALALHYAVRHCTREVVKALLELGAADVNRPAGPNGQTALHVAAEMACPDMVAVLLDHHADPGVRAADGSTPLDILRGLTSDFLFKGVVPGLPHVEPNRLRLCLELVQSAAQVMSREDAASREIYPSMDTESDRCEAECSLGVDSRILYLNLGMASAAHLGCKIDDSSRHQGDGGIGSSSMFSSQGFP